MLLLYMSHILGIKKDLTLHKFSFFYSCLIKLILKSFILILSRLDVILKEDYTINWAKYNEKCNV